MPCPGISRANLNISMLFRILELRPILCKLKPILSKQLHRMLSSIRTIPASERIDGTILVAPPANPLGVFRIHGKLFRHFGSPAIAKH